MEPVFGCESGRSVWVVASDVTERLLEAAVSVFARHGFAGAGVAEIARQAGLTTGAIYARWSCKADLLAEAVDHTLVQMLPVPPHRSNDSTEDLSPGLATMFKAIPTGDETACDVVIQAAASAAASDIVAESLAGFINTQAHQLATIIDAARHAERLDPRIDTAALALLCAAVTIGTHLVLSAGLAETHTPSPDNWDALLSALLESMATPGGNPTAHVDAVQPHHGRP